MAKEQGLSLNPTKISGTCGRLMCCLKYEEAAYEDALKELPRPGSYIDTPEGRGMVAEVNAISKNVKVKLERRPDAAPMTFQYSALEGLTRKPALREAEAAPEVRVKVRHEEFPAAEPQPAPPPRQQRRPERPVHEKAAHEGKPAPGEAPAERAEKTEAARRPAGGKNWRERHAPRKQEPANRQPPPPQQQQPQQQQPQQQRPPKQQQPQKQAPVQQPRAAQQQKPEQPQKQASAQQPRSDVKSVPRYGEVRRANAPQQQPGPGGANYHRQPWQKNRGEQRLPREAQDKQQGGQKTEK